MCVQRVHRNWAWDSKYATGLRDRQCAQVLNLADGRKTATFNKDSCKVRLLSLALLAVTSCLLGGCSQQGSRVIKAGCR